MPVELLILFLAFVVFLAFFVGLNIGNTCTFWFFKTYTEILKTLTNDQYNILTAKLNNIVQTSKVTYIYPEATCPECGATIEEEQIDSMLNLLFTRAQLVQIKSL